MKAKNKNNKIIDISSEFDRLIVGDLDDFFYNKRTIEFDKNYWEIDEESYFWRIETTGIACVNMTFNKKEYEFIETSGHYVFVIK